MRQAVTLIPTPLAGIETGTQYTVQNKGSTPVNLSVVETVSDITTLDKTDNFIIPPYFAYNVSYIYPTADEGQSIYVWVDSDSSEVAYDETS